MKIKTTLLVVVVGIMALPSLTFASFDRNLKIGTRGQDVSDLQEILVDQGCLTTSPTGYFGLLTFKGVQCFQAKNNLPSTGYFGVLSRGVADKIFAQVASSSDEAELAETGTNTPVVACGNGAKFNYLTGQLCQPDNQTLLNKITDLQTQVQSLQTIQTQPNTGTVRTPVVPVVVTPPVPEYKVTFGTPRCSTRLDDGAMNLYTSIPTSVSDNYYTAKYDVEGTSTLGRHIHATGNWYMPQHNEEIVIGLSWVNAPSLDVTAGTYSYRIDLDLGNGKPSITREGQITINSCQ